MKALGITITAPKPQNGYTYVYRGLSWREALGDEWEVVTRAVTNTERYIGERYIDGGACYVWLAEEGSFIAQPSRESSRPSGIHSRDN